MPIDANGGLTILTVAYHSQQPLNLLAEELTRQTCEPNQWIVVNNSPLSAGCLQISPSPSFLSIIEGGEGDGFGKGCNRGMDYLQKENWGGWVWLLNPDTTMPDDTIIERLLVLLAKVSPRAFVGTGVVGSNGSLEASAGWIDPGLAFRRRKVNASSKFHINEVGAVSVDWISGCSFLLRPSVHLVKPRFDLALCLYYEDIDLCLRFSKTDDIPILWMPMVTIGHQKGTGSEVPSTRRIRLSSCSYIRFMQRHCSWWVIAIRMVRMTIKALFLGLIKPMQGHAVLQGCWEAFRRPLA